MRISSQIKGMGIFLLLAVFFVGCASPMRGTGSVTLLTRDLDTSSKSIEVISGPKEETETFYYAAIFFIWGDPLLTHETPISRLLAKNKADVLLNAEITDSMIFIPYLFQMQKVTVKGTPARYKEGK